jgi:hypothetical protein
MNHIIDLLKEKNQFLERFYNLNEQELVSLNEGNFENVEVFYNNREGILATINKIDKLIEDEGHFVEDAELISDQEKHSILTALNYKNELVTQILSQDLQILSVIEQTKSDLIKDLSQVQTARKVFQAYKSGDSRPQLDEEY